MSIIQGNIKKLRNVLLVLIGLYMVLGSTLYLIQERMLFLPTVLADDFKFEFDTPFEELNFTPEPNVSLNAILFKSNSPKGVIMYSHGNAGDLSRWGEIAKYFTDYNYDVLVWDYRTYGKSKGHLSEEAIYSDAQFIYDFLNERYSSLELILYGRSLGTGVSSYLASKNSASQLILETPYYSIVDVAQHRFPIFPVKKLMKYTFPNYEYLKNVNALITVFHGTEDKVVPYESALKLRQLNLKNFNLVTIEGGGHNNLDDFDLYHRHIEQLLNKKDP